MAVMARLAPPKAPKRPSTRPNPSKKPSKPNASILSFFQKTEKQEESLFVGSVIAAHHPSQSDHLPRLSAHSQPSSPQKPGQWNDGLPEPASGTRLSKYQEATSPPLSPRPGPAPESHAAAVASKSRSNLPFVIDSESEDEAAPPAPDLAMAPREAVVAKPLAAPGLSSDTTSPAQEQDSSTLMQASELSALIDLQDDVTDKFLGEESREMQYMAEQARLEAEDASTTVDDDTTVPSLYQDFASENCPMCDSSLLGLSSDDATRHVNSCLDRPSTPPPKRRKCQPIGSPPALEIDSAELGKRFARAAIPRPAQASPFRLDDGRRREEKTDSAFSRIMSNNAEDSAWATAAAKEQASRGRPAYERTCPFYKIIPGFQICVDAFRYGAVEGCEAYFLSHFHSDHYIGLTASWRHGPIYCSKVTGALIKQQLHTASKWVVELEFEKPYEVPGTQVTATLIPANHCPGSCLFLFQRMLPGRGNKGSTLQRVLHCGDFRACPSHLSHPLLRPDLIDPDTGQSRQQKIDVCYLDTTYLNPRYSFPPQEDVVKACAAFCASVSPDPHCPDDVWARSSRRSDSPAVSTYFQVGKADDADVVQSGRDKDRKGGKRSSREGQSSSKPRQRLLVVCGTYSIGKERICVAIAKAMGSKIFANPYKMKICRQLDDAELTSLLTSDPVEAQVHMQSLMEIRAETLQDYLDSYKPHFSRVLGFRPSGWTFRNAHGKSVPANAPPGSIPTQQILHGKGWRTSFGLADFLPQRGSTREAACFGVPYSEHSSFRELAMFVMGLRIAKIIPTVNVGNAQSRQRMKSWLDRWTAERKRGGLVRPFSPSQGQKTSAQGDELEPWDGSPGRGGGAWW